MRNFEDLTIIDQIYEFNLKDGSLRSWPILQFNEENLQFGKVMIIEILYEGKRQKIYAASDIPMTSSPDGTKYWIADDQLKQTLYDVFKAGSKFIENRC